MNDKLELLSPAGDMERLEMALCYGADAVYLAGTEFGMRASAGNFDSDQLQKAVALAHSMGRRVYVTCNTLPREDELVRLPEYLEMLDASGVDAVIVADMGVIAMAKKYAPRVKLHVSTQFGVINSAAANALYDLGADTVVLARETPLEDIRKIRANTPKELRLEDVRVFLRALPAVELFDRQGRKPRPVRPALPLEVSPRRGKAPR